MASTNSPRPSLPSIHSLDMDKYRREEVEQRARTSDMAGATIPTLVSVGSYPAGPPPPYSAAPQTSPLPSKTSVHHPYAPSNTESSAHKTEEELIKKHAMQSLPPLHEALGAERPPTTYAAEPTTRPSHAISPRQHPRGLHAMDPPVAPAFTSSHTHPHDPYAQPTIGQVSQRVSAERSTYRYHDSSAYARQPAPRSPQFSRRDGPSYRQPEPSSPGEREPQLASRADRSFSYGYAPYSPRFSHGSSLGTSTAQIYQPSVAHPPPPSQPTWKPASQGYPAWDHSRDDASSSGSHQESVKRHLDLYDVELALNEIADNSMLMLDFSRSYGARLHQTQRSGPVPGTLPAITEVDDLMNKSRHTLDSLNRLREVLIAQQAAMYQQAQEQRFKTESEAKRNDSMVQLDDSKGDGFAGPEPKKRRGRTTAPGRCHSCQRAETPEWRRGPDGARTLCNACGLHYAKLTRKAGANKAAIGSSNLRPKAGEEEVASP